jgi:Alpha-(1,6)-fucosyltransferase N- and catalytic domains
LHPVSQLLLKPQKIFLFELGAGDLQGFGSFTVNMILQAIYFDHHHDHRTLVVDETHCSNYRKNKTHGVFSGFFDTSFPVIRNSKLEYSQVKQELETELLLLTTTRTAVSSSSNSTVQQQQMQPSQPPPPPPTVPSTTLSSPPPPLSLSSLQEQQQQEQQQAAAYDEVVSSSLERLAWKWTSSKWYTYKYADIPPWHGYWFRNKTFSNPVVKVTLQPQYSLTSFGPARWTAHAYYQLDDDDNDDEGKTTNNNKVRVFYLLSDYLCTSLQPNAETRASIQELWNQASIPHPQQSQEQEQPTDVRSNTTTTTATSFTTVAFHIRRGDKILLESRVYETMEYVEKLQHIVGRNNQEELSRIRYCYVATDDYHVVSDLQQSLKEAGITCTLYTLTQPGYVTTRHAEDFVLFLAQLELLLHTTYFIGTFNSNVGGLAALYRGCHYHHRRRRQEEEQQQEGQQPQDEDPAGNQPDTTRVPLSNRRSDTHDDPFENVHLSRTELSNKFNHFFHSYGVDVDDWYLK